MKSKLMTAIAVFGLLASTSVSAQTFSPSGSYTWAGPVLVNKAPSPAFPCVLTVTVSDATSPAQATSIEFTQFGPTPPGLCETIDVTNLPLPLSWNSSTRELTILGLDVNTPTPGGCAGNISAILGANPNPSMTIASSLPGKGGTSPCLINSLAPLPLLSPVGGTVN